MKCIREYIKLNQDMATNKMFSNINPHVKMNNEISTSYITFITIQNKSVIHMYCLCYVLYLSLYFDYFLLFPNLNGHLCHGVYWCNHTPTYILTL